MAYTDVFTSSTIYASDVSYSSLTLSADTTLSWPLDSDSGQNLASKIIDVTASGAYAIALPDATLVSPGQTILFNNLGATTFTVKSSGGSVILTVASGQQWQAYLSSNTTAAGVWRVYQMGATTSSAVAGSLAGYGIKAISTTLNQKIDYVAKSADYTIVDADRAKLINWTGGLGTLTLPSAASVGSDWFISVRNNGTGSLTVSSSSTIDGSSSKTFSISDTATIVCDGTNFYTFGFGQSATFAFDYTLIDVSGGSNYTLSGVELNRISYQFVGTMTANFSIIIPSTVQQYWINNQTSGGYTLTIKTATQPSPTVLTNAQRGIYYCDGSTIINAVTASVIGTISGGSF